MFKWFCCDILRSGLLLGWHKYVGFLEGIEVSPPIYVWSHYYVGRKRVDHFNSIGMLWRKYSYILSLLMLNFTNRRSLVSMDEKEWEISKNKFLGEQHLGIKWKATVALQIIVSLSSWCSLNPTLMVMSTFSTCWRRESPGTCIVIP